MVDVVGLGGVDVPVEDGQQSERVRLSVGGIGKADIGVGRGVMAIGHERRTAEPLPRLKPHSHREPVANEPNSARAGEYDELVRASGWRSGLTASTPATQALTKIASTTASPAQRSARSDRSAKAAPTGMVVAASPKLWIRSASSAMLLVAINRTSWATAASPRIARDSPTARSPSRERTIERSTRPCECP